MSMISVVLPLYVPSPFLVAMTEFCIKSMRLNTKLDYQLVIVETGSRHFDPARGGVVDPLLKVDRYVHFDELSSYTRDFNAGCDAATLIPDPMIQAVAPGYIVHMGNDVIVTEGWLEALVEPFDVYPDCGVSCCAATEPGAFIGPPIPVPRIVEGMFAPMMMFRSNWRLDEAYAGGYSDSDLIMRLYNAGHRAYRNCRVIVHHMNRMTWRHGVKDQGVAQVEAGERLFYERWGESPLHIFMMLKAGQVVYGRELDILYAPVIPYSQRVAQGRAL